MTGLTGSRLRGQVSTGVLAGVNRSSERNTNRIYVSRRSVRWGLVGLTLVVLLVLSAGAVSADPDAISGCDVIDESGEYELTEDVVAEQGDDVCLSIVASDVVLDGQGHTIAGPNVDATDSTAIFIGAPENVTVKNVTVANWSTGILAQGEGIVEDYTLDSVTAVNVTTGIAAQGIANSTLTDIEVRDAESDDSITGVQLQEAVNTTLHTLTVENQQYTGIGGHNIGLELTGVVETTIQGLEVQGLGASGEAVPLSVHGIIADSAEHTTVTNASIGDFEMGFVNAGIAGIEFTESENTTITDTDVYDLGLMGAEGGVDGLTFSTSDNTTVQHVTVRNVSIGQGGWGVGIRIGNSQTSLVQESTVTNVSSGGTWGTTAGIELTGVTDTVVDDVTVEHVESVDAVAGIELTSAFGTEIQHTAIADVVGTSNDGPASSIGIDAEMAFATTIDDVVITNVRADSDSGAANSAGIVIREFGDIVARGEGDEVVEREVETTDSTIRASSITNVTATADGESGQSTSRGVAVHNHGVTVDTVAISDVRADGGGEYTESVGIALREVEQMRLETDVETASLSDSTVLNASIANVSARSDAGVVESNGISVVFEEEMSEFSEDVESSSPTILDSDITNVRAAGGDWTTRSGGILTHGGQATTVDTVTISDVLAESDEGFIESTGIAIGEVMRGAGVTESVGSESTDSTVHDSTLTNVTAALTGENDSGETFSSGIVTLSPETVVDSTTITEITVKGGEFGEAAGIMVDVYFSLDTLEETDTATTIRDSTVANVSAEDTENGLASGAQVFGESHTVQNTTLTGVSADASAGLTAGLLLFTMGATVEGNTVEYGTNEGDSIEEGFVPAAPGILVMGPMNTFSDNTVQSFETGISMLPFEGGGIDNEFQNTTIRDTSEWAVDSFNGGFGSNSFGGLDLGYEDATLSFDLQDVRLNAVDENARPALPDEYDDIGVFFEATEAQDVAIDALADASTLFEVFSTGDRVDVSREQEPTVDTGFLNLTIDYGETATEGVDEETLALWNYSDGWNRLDSTLDTGARTISHNITDFSTFAPLGEAVVPATPELSDLDVAGQGPEATLTEGDAEDVTVTVENVGEEPGAFTVDLVIENGDSIAGQTSTDELAPGENETVVFEAVTGDLGPATYDVTVSAADDTIGGSLTVEADEETPDPDPEPDPTPPPEPEPEPEPADVSIEKSLNTTIEDLDQLHIDVRHASPHQAFDLWLSAPNATVAPHEMFDLRASRDNVTLARGMAGFEDLNVTLEMGDVSLENVTFTTREGGHLNLTINGSSEALPTTPEEEFPVAGLAELGYMSLNASFASDDVAFRFRLPADTIAALQSEAETVTMYEFHEEFGGWVQRSTEFVEEDEETETLVFEMTASEFAYSEWAVVAERPVFEIVDTDVGATTVTVGESVTVEATVANTGTLDGEYALDLLVDGVSVDGESVAVEAGATEQGTFTYTFTEAGEYTLDVNDAFVADVTVETEESEPDDEPPEDDTDDADETDATDDVVETDDADDDGAGLGVVAAVLAVLALAVYSTRRIAGKTNS